MKRYKRIYMATVKKLISFDTSVAQELEMVSKTLNITQKELIERALDFYFDYTDSLVAQKISEDVEEKREKVYDAKDVFQKLGLN